MAKFVMDFAKANYEFMAPAEGEWNGVVKVFDGLGAARIGTFVVLFGGNFAALWERDCTGGEFWWNVLEDGFGFGVDLFGVST